MTNWNVPKIREECLRLMGIIRRPGAVLYEDASGQPLPTFFEAGVAGMNVFRQEIPDPTKSLDDALPLAHKYEIGIDFSGSGMATVTNRFGTVFEFTASSVALAVCLCALRCAGHNLDDFKVKP